MARDSFTDRLAAQRAENERHAGQIERAAARQRRDDYNEGKAAAADIIGRVAAFGSTYERNTATLRKAAQQQPNSLAGRVAAAELAEAAEANEAATPDTQAEARRLEALSAAERIAAARTRNAQRGIERDPDRDF